MKSQTCKDLFLFLGVYIIVLLIQFSGSIITFTSVTDWYPNLVLPAWNPPNWLFGPVWMILYLLLAIAIWLIIRSEDKSGYKKTCYLLTVFGLLANFLWTIFFFGLKSPLLGMIDLFILDIIILFSICAYAKVNKIAAWLLVPYLLWIIYATTLNVGIYCLN